MKKSSECRHGRVWPSRKSLSCLSSSHRETVSNNNYHLSSLERTFCLTKYLDCAFEGPAIQSFPIGWRVNTPAFTVFNSVIVKRICFLPISTWNFSLLTQTKEPSREYWFSSELIVPLKYRTTFFQSFRSKSSERAWTYIENPYINVCSLYYAHPEQKGHDFLNSCRVSILFASARTVTEREVLVYSNSEAAWLHFCSEFGWILSDCIVLKNRGEWLGTKLVLGSSGCIKFSGVFGLTFPIGRLFNKHRKNS